MRLVYLKGDMDLIGQRLRGRKHHFMPASLLESQFAALEEPGADERALIVSVAMSPRRVVGTIVERLGLEPAPQERRADMAPSADFLEFLQDQLRGLGRITTRRMFSGAGLYCDGVIFALILRDTLYFKVDDGNRAAYEAEGLEPFTYEARGRTCGSAPTGRCPSGCSTSPTRCSTGRAARWPRARRAAGEEEAETRREPPSGVPRVRHPSRRRPETARTMRRGQPAGGAAPAAAPTSPASRTAPPRA